MIGDDAHRTALQKELTDLKALENSRAVNNNVDREIIIRLIRLIETFLYNEPSTPIPPRHHA